MSEHDPTLVGQAFNWLLGTVLTLSLFFGSFTMKRSAARQDKLEERLRKLEKESVTHQDLQRIEDKIDKLLDRMLEKN